MLSKNINNYFLALYSLIPISILVGPMISLANIVLIDLSFIILILFKKDFSFFKNRTFQYLFILYLYLIFNTIISLDPNSGINRNFGFIRIIIFFLSINYFYQQKNFFNKVFYFWLMVISVVVLDVFFESVFGRNILGYGADFVDGRVYSFFKNEAIVGSYVYAFFLILLGFFLNKHGSNKKYIIFIFAIVFLFSIFVTGERASSVKSLISITIFFLIFKEFKLKNKILLIATTLTGILLLIMSSDYLKLRFVDQIKYNVSFKHNNYFYLYKSGIEVFKNYPVFGVGNKNYRIATCGKNTEDLKENEKNYFCSTHPHQIYFEFLAEHGLLGTLVIFYLLYSIIFSKWKIFFSDNNYIQYGTFIYLILVFLPIIPTGAFFGDFLLTLFAINLSLLYASNPKTNIFKK